MYSFPVSTTIVVEISNIPWNEATAKDLKHIQNFLNYPTKLLKNILCLLPFLSHTPWSNFIKCWWWQNLILGLTNTFHLMLANVVDQVTRRHSLRHSFLLYCSTTSTWSDQRRERETRNQNIHICRLCPRRVISQGGSANISLAHSTPSLKVKWDE